MIKKFRAYYKPDLNTPDGALKFEQKEINGDLFFVYDDDIKYPFQIPFLDDDWIVQQYIGIDDKNGVQIYEGDFIKNDHDDIGTIEYRGGYFVLSMKKREDVITNGWGLFIIGNIMENPKLIDK